MPIEEGGPRSQETQQQPEIPIVKDGLSAIVLPELGNKARYGESKPATQEETMRRLNTWLEGLNQQGVDIVSIMDVSFAVDRRGASGDSEERKVAIVRKQPKEKEIQPSISEAQAQKDQEGLTQVRQQLQ